MTLKFRVDIQWGITMSHGQVKHSSVLVGNHLLNENTGDSATLKYTIALIKMSQKGKTILPCPLCRYQGSRPPLGHHDGVKKPIETRPKMKKKLPEMV